MPPGPTSLIAYLVKQGSKIVIQYFPASAEVCGTLAVVTLVGGWVGGDKGLLLLQIL